MTTPTNIEFTDAVVRDASCPDGKGQAYLRDTKQPGLALRLRSSGAKTFCFLSTRPGRKGSHFTSIGPFPKLKVAAARKQAAILAGQRAAGADLIAAKRERTEVARAAARAKSMTLGALIAEKDGQVCPYEASLIADKFANVQIPLSSLRRNLLPAHKTTDIRKLVRRDFTTIIDKLKGAGKPGAAADFRKHAQRFLAWAERSGYVDHNVLAGLRQPRQTRNQALDRTTNKRSLSDAEIKAMWHAASKFGAFGLLVQLSLLAGTRRGEPAAIEWAKNVLADRIHLGKEITKMGKSHDIPRTALVDAVLDDAKRFQRATSDVVFPSSKTGGRISGFSKLLPKLIKQAGTAPWTMHDLRRSLRTVISKCGYDDEVQRACLGQSAPAFDQIYNFDEKFSLRKMAFEAAHAYVAAAVAGQSTDEVVKQQRAANPQNALKLQLLARLAALHAEG